MIDYERTKAWTSGDVRQSYTEKDTILYALGLGIGSDPVDEQQLRFVYEKNLVSMPTMAAVLASPGAWMRDRKELGIDFFKLVHGEQSVILHRPIPCAGTVIGRSRVTRIVDKGEGKGAVMHVEKALYDEQTGDHIATAEQVLFLRGDGGFSQGGSGDEAATPAPATPESEPELVVELPTRTDAALLYRLSGDSNPLHADPVVAQKVGFSRPILHGLATYGNACHGIVKAYCDYDPARLKEIRARLTSPVFPGETIVLECWKISNEEVAFRGRLKERDVQVLSNGRARLG